MEKEGQDKRDTAKRKAAVFAADAMERGCQVEEAERAVAEAKGDLASMLAAGLGDEFLHLAQFAVDRAVAQSKEREGTKRRAVQASTQADVEARKLGALSPSSGPLGRLFASSSREAGGAVARALTEDVGEAAAGAVVGADQALPKSQRAKRAVVAVEASTLSAAGEGDVPRLPRGAARGSRETPEVVAQGDSGWRRFSPELPDQGKCMARVFGAQGRGGQCSVRRAEGGEFCRAHATQDRWHAHGRVDGPIPEAKWKDFVKAEQRRARLDVGLGVVAESAGGVRADPLVTTRGDGEALQEVATDVEQQSRSAMDAGGSVQSNSASGLGKRRRGRGGVRGLQETHAENEFVDEEMRKRHFHLTSGGQWLGGVLLPGDPEDDQFLEGFLRQQFRAKREQEQTSSTDAAWGAGRRLGGPDRGAV